MVKPYSTSRKSLECGAVADEELVAGGVRARGGDGEVGLVEGDGAAVGGVVEQVGDGLQDHVVVLGELVLRLWRGVVKGAAVDEVPRVEEVVTRDHVWSVRRRDERPVRFKLGLLLGEERRCRGREKRLQLGGPADGHAGRDVLARGQHGAPELELGVRLEAQRGREDGVHGGALELAHDGPGRVSQGAKEARRDSKDGLLGLHEPCKSLESW